MTRNANGSTPSLMPDFMIGFVAIARSTFDIPLAESVTAQARAALQQAGFTLSGPDGLVLDADGVVAARAALAGRALDMLVVFQATFADSTMIQDLAGAIDAPLVLWAIPEERDGGRLRLNSLCGINLAGHALKRRGRVYDALYAPPDDADAIQRITQLARAGHARRRLQGAKIARVGEHPDGFDTCRFDGPALQQRFGVEVQQYALDDLFAQVRAVEPVQIDALHAEVAGQVRGTNAVDQPALRGTLATNLTLRRWAADDDLAGFALRCWPQFFTDLGCAACGSSSMLNEAGLPCSCETDVNGTITQLMLQWISGAPVFGTDLVSFDDETAVLWHCGKAPLSMADPDFAPQATIHTNRKMPLLMEFPLKPGRVTLARLSEASGDYRLVIGGGEMVKAPMSYTGTSGVVRFDRPAREVLQTILDEGLEHHLALTYGDYLPALEALARMLDLPVLRLS